MGAWRPIHIGEEERHHIREQRRQNKNLPISGLVMRHNNALLTCQG